MTPDEVRTIIREELAFLIKQNKLVFDKPIQILNGNDITLGQSFGTRIGTSNTQKLGFYGVTPIVQQGTVSDPSSAGATYDQNQVQGIVNAVEDIIAVLDNCGITG